MASMRVSLVSSATNARANETLPKSHGGARCYRAVETSLRRRAAIFALGDLTSPQFVRNLSDRNH